MGNLFQSGSQTSSSTSSTAPPSDVLAAYQALIKQAQGTAATPYQAYSGQQVAGFSPDQLAAFQGTRDAQGIQTPYLGQATTDANASVNGLNPGAIQSFMNPYTQNVIDATLAQSDQRDAAQQNALKGSTVGSGGLGNSRLGVMQATLAGQQGQNRDSLIANLNSQNYGQAVNTAGTAAQLAGQGAFTLGNLGNEAQYGALAGNNALLNMGGLQQQLAQANLNVPYQQWQQQQAYPFATTNWLSGIEGNIGSKEGMTTSGTQTTPTASAGSQLLGGITSMLGGSGMGSQMLGSVGSSLGSLFGGGTAAAGTLGTAAGLSGDAMSWLPMLALANRGGRINGYAAGGAVSPGFSDLTANLAHAIHHLRAAAAPRYADGGTVPYDPGMASPSVYSPVAGAMMGDNPNMAFAFDPTFGTGAPYAAKTLVPDALPDDGRGLPPPQALPPPQTSGWGAKVAPTPTDTTPPPGPIAGANTHSGLDPFDHALMVGGLSLMANKDPNIGTAIGEAGLAGVGDYDKQQANIRAGKLSQAELDMKAQDLAQRAAEAQGKLKNESQRNSIMAAGQQRYQYQTVVGADGQPQVMAMPTRGAETPGMTAVGSGAIAGKSLAHTDLSPTEIDANATKTQRAAEKAQQTIEIHNSKLTGQPIDAQAQDRIRQAGIKALLEYKAGYKAGPGGQPLGVTAPATVQGAIQQAQPVQGSATPANDPYAAAKDALAKGAPPAAVRDRLLQMKLDPSQVGLQ